MASRARHRQEDAASGRGAVARLCSINSNGLVFLASARLDVSSDVTLAILTSGPDVPHEWDVHGWVVDCRAVRCRRGPRYRVTLLFHDLPAGLREILAGEHKDSPRRHPPLPNSAIFGLN